MGHTAIPILMAVLSYCVWENAEVSARQSESFVTAHCSSAVCLAKCLVFDKISYFLFMPILITTRKHSCSYLHIAHPYPGQV